MSFKIVEIFRSIQGEGILSGHVVTFVRFKECNLNCEFCDTYLGTYSLLTTKEIISFIIKTAGKCPEIVFTGGEPLLQNDLFELASLLVEKGFHLHLETNGTLPLGPMKGLLRGVSMSPKIPRIKIMVPECTSLKILYPYYNGVTADDFQDYSAIEKSLQIISPEKAKPEFFEQAIEECIRLGPSWKIGIQLHKFIGVK